MTEQNKTFAEIAKAAIKHTVPQQNTITPKITLSNKTHQKMVALILEAHIASLHDPRQYGQILSKSLKENFDIDATFPDRDSKKIFNFYYNQDNNDETDMDDDQYIDDNDIRGSSLNISDFHSADPPLTKETEKRPRSHDDFHGKQHADEEPLTVLENHQLHHQMDNSGRRKTLKTNKLLTYKWLIQDTQ